MNEKNKKKLNLILLANVIRVVGLIGVIIYLKFFNKKDK